MTGTPDPLTPFLRLGTTQELTQHDDIASPEDWGNARLSNAAIPASAPECDKATARVDCGPFYLG